MSGLLEPLVLGVLLLEEPSKLRRERERSRLAVLRLTRVEPNFARLEIDAPPFEGKHLRRDAPAGERSKLDDGQRMPCINQEMGRRQLPQLKQSTDNLDHEQIKEEYPQFAQQ